MMKKGFTLAEVLITLGIIGVVAALTLPGIMQSYQKKDYVDQLQRVYNEVVNGAKAYMSEKGVDKLNDGGGLANSTNEFVSKYLATADTGSSASTFFASSYKSLNGDKTVSMPTVDGSCAALDAGPSICVAKMTAGSSGRSLVYVDLNGKSNPNVIGRDFFVFALKNDGKIDATADKTACTGASNIGAAAYCMGLVRGKNWTMDY